MYVEGQELIIQLYRDYEDKYSLTLLLPGVSCKDFSRQNPFLQGTDRKMAWF